ncbi:uncharacterized protein LOC144647358 [Oculina patagonica]
MSLRRSSRVTRPPVTLKDFDLPTDPEASGQARAIREELDHVESLLESLTPEAGRRSASSVSKPRGLTPETERRLSSDVLRLQNENLKLELELTRAKIDLARTQSEVTQNTQSKMAAAPALAHGDTGGNTPQQGRIAAQRSFTPSLKTLQTDPAVQEDLKTLEESLGDPILLGLSEDIADPAQQLLEPRTSLRDPQDQSRLDMEVLNFRKQAYASSTKTTYKSQLRAYLIFCVYYGYKPLPASTVTLSRYAAFLARSLSVSSIPAYLNIVRILHLEHGLEDPTKNNFHLATTLRGIRRSKGHTVTQKKPMTPDMLLAIKAHLNLTDPAHANFWAVCLVGFFGLLRKANMLLKGIAKFNPLKNLRRGDIVFYPDWVIIINRWSKTIQFSQ